MIKETYVSFEVAKLLKEKGFNEKCRGCYHYEFDDNNNSIVMLGEWTAQPYSNDFVDEGFLCSAPTIQMAMKWLRKVHNILLFILPGQENGKLVYLVEVWTWNEEEGLYESTYAPMPRKEPEQAVDAALKYSLENLI